MRIDNPYHPTIATTLDLVKTLLALDPANHDPAVSRLAKAVWPENGDKLWKGVVIADNRFDPDEPFNGTTRAKFNNGTITVDHAAFTDFNIKGPWFEVQIIQRDSTPVYRSSFSGPYGDESYCFDLEIIRGKNTVRYLDWAKRTGTLLKMFS